MIEVRIFLNKGAPIGLEVSGHSGLSARGSDILCAAVSVLAENLGAGIQFILGKHAVIKEDDGFYSIHLTGEDLDSGTDLLFSSAILGLQNLSGQYPERIKITSGVLEA